MKSRLEGWRHLWWCFYTKQLSRLYQTASHADLSIFYFSLTPLFPFRPLSNWRMQKNKNSFLNFFYDISCEFQLIHPIQIAPLYLPLNLMFLETWSFNKHSRGYCTCLKVPSQRSSIKYDTWRTMTTHTQNKLFRRLFLGAKHFFPSFLV